MCVFLFARFSVFLAIFHVLLCEFLIFLICQCSRHIPGPTVCVSVFPHFSVFSIQSRSYSVCFSFSTFSVFLAICDVLSCEFLIFYLFQFYRHLPGPTVCIYHFPTFSVCLAIFQVLQCVCFIFHFFQFYFVTYSRS
jgi:hypothetical protein